MSMAGTGWRHRWSSVRVRTTMAAVAVVALALAIGAVALVTVLRRSLTDQVRTAAQLRAADVLDSLATGELTATLAVGEEDDLFIQVIDERGVVVTASRNVSDRSPVADVPPGESRTVDDVGIEDDDSYLVVAVAGEADGAPVTVLVGREAESVVETTNLVGGLLVLGIPALLVVVGVVTWRVVGGALRPVESIRAEVADISTSELYRRVPEPGTGDEVARLAGTMNEMLARLEASHERQRRFVADASHELRSPVTTIRQHAEVALAHPDRTTVDDLAETVLAEDLRIQALVEDLLLLARADEGRLAGTSVTAVDLDDVVVEEARRLRRGAGAALDLGAVSAGQVTGDAAQLRRMVGNVIDNAVRHAAGQVQVSLSEQGGEVVLTVDDDGPGIPAEEQERVFERFVRLEEARGREGGGSGLGMAIVAEVVRAHHGMVTIGDSPLGGARIEIRLPARRGSPASFR